MNLKNTFYTNDNEEIEYNGISFSSSNSKVYSLNGARLDRLTPLSGIAIKNRSK